MIYQVRCIDDEWGEVPPEYVMNMTPKKGGIYTILEILPPGNAIRFSTKTKITQVMISFDEIYFLDRPVRPCFNAEYFVPVKPVSIEVFYNILKDPNVPIPE